MALSFGYAVLEWARTKPADERYNYVSNCGCAVAQFLKDTGRCRDPMVLASAWYDRSDGYTGLHRLPLSVDYAASALPHTFGAFADRLEKALAK